MIHTALIAGVFFAGAFFGSFFYTLALRSMKGMKPREMLFTFSRCPACSKRVSFIGLIPVIGYFLLRGRCSCGAKINISYPAFEVTSGLIFILVYLHSGAGIVQLIIALTLLCSIGASICDIKTFRIPDAFTVTIILLSIPLITIEQRAASSAIAFAIITATAAALAFFFAGGIGGGDVKYAAAITLFLGIPDAVIALETALITGTICGLIYALIKKRGLRIKIPMAPFLTAGLFVAVFFSEKIIDLYYIYVL